MGDDINPVEAQEAAPEVKTEVEVTAEAVEESAAAPEVVADAIQSHNEVDPA